MNPFHQSILKISPGNHFLYPDQGPKLWWLSVDFTRNLTWPVFYDYIPVYEIWIQYITVFKRYRPETIFHWEIKGHNSDNNWWILSIIKLDLYFMIMYLCMKYESNTPSFQKISPGNHFSYVRDRTYGTYVCTYGRTRVMLYAPPPPPPAPDYKWRGHNKDKQELPQTKGSTSNNRSTTTEPTL